LETQNSETFAVSYLGLGPRGQGGKEGGWNIPPPFGKRQLLPIFACQKNLSRARLDGKKVAKNTARVKTLKMALSESEVAS